MFVNLKQLHLQNAFSLESRVNTSRYAMFDVTSKAMEASIFESENDG